MKTLGYLATAGGLAACVLLTPAAAGQCVPHWDLAIGNPGLGQVNALTIHDDGTGPALYAGGAFANHNGIQYNHVAKYDGTAWVPVGEGVTTGAIVNSIASFNGELYITGQFTAAGGVPANHIAKWNGTEWAALGSGLQYIGQKLVTWDDGTGEALYVAGQFTTAGGVAGTSRIARWDGANWSALSTGLNTAAKTMLVWDDGTGAALYVAGPFATAGGVSTSKIARWDGTQWYALGSGLTGGSSFGVWGLGAYNGSLYACGNFTGAGGVSVARIARWDGTAWYDVGGGAGENYVYTVAAFDDGDGEKLYAAGSFTTVAGGTIQANKVATWDGAQWGVIGEQPYVGIGGNAVLCSLNDGSGSLLFGGNISSAGQNPEWSVSNLLEWVGCPPASEAACCYPDGSCAVTTQVDCTGVWHGEWPDCEVAQCPLPSAACCYIDGSCAVTTEAECAGIWHPEWADCTVAQCPVPMAACCYPGGVCAVTSLVECTGVWHEEWVDCEVAQCPECGPDWDAAIGQPGMEQLPPWSGATVRALTTWNDGTGRALYAGGAFEIAAGEYVYYIAKWDGTDWSGLNGGMSESGSIGIPAVMSLTTFDDGTGEALYAGGAFGRAGGVWVGGIAKWDGQNWSALSGGIGGTTRNVQCLEVFDDGTGSALYVGGDFASVDGLPLHNLAKWDGQQWSFNGAMPYDNVVDMAVFDDGSGPALFVGGIFHAVGELTVNHIAKWDGTNWSALQYGTDTNVLALETFDDGSGPALYVGGQFTFVSGQPASYMAKWDGTNWTEVGGGMNSFVHKLYIFDDGSGPALYASGEFTEAGGLPANHIARWNGQRWSGLGTGLNDDAFSMAGWDDGSGPDLYVGGWFTAAGGLEAHSIATWRGCLAPPQPGDLNCDYAVNALDINPFVQAMVDPQAYAAAFPDCDRWLADCNGDGAVNALDINPFVRILTAEQ